MTGTSLENLFQSGAVNMAEVLRRTGLSRTWLYDLMQRGDRELPAASAERIAQALRDIEAEIAQAREAS